ncbi:MAG: hypothetical protein P1Q69_07970 [Candidatus Thorarchaeota archaeon]|nr:hypothetical protein [Candidatus Thorarchaeota archaeon]
MGTFYPISPLVSITNTSFSAQAGVMDEMWACRVVRGKKILAEKTMPELDLENFVGVIYGHIRVEGLSRHAVATCAGRLMQFSRTYQQSGVAPNYEVPDLFRDDGDAYITEGGSTTTESDAGGVAETPADLPYLPIGHLPSIAPQVGKDAWRYISESHGVMISEIAAYSATLPKGHLEAMFEKVADDLVRMWIDNEDPMMLPTKFGEMIFSCSSDSQMPKTGTLNISIETQGCAFLKAAREVDPDGTKLPRGFPCAFHEIIARKVEQVTGLTIGVNTSSTGCIVTMSFDQ